MLTRHAQQRHQQRSISHEAIDLLIQYGAVDYHRGVEIYSFDKHGWKKLCEEAACACQFRDKLKNCYAVVAEGMVITVGHKQRHFKRNRH
ncbi:MAG: hypothetical protein V7739_19455 [Motiliproteus sp.]